MSLLFVLYYAAALLLFIYGMNCYVLVLNFRRHRRSALARLEKVREEYWQVPDADLPTVTVQLPVYNERYVVGRVIQAVCHLHWPREKLEIQVLDDSTDETTAIVGELVSHFQAQGIRIVHVRRTSREGFKAGALQNGLTAATGELIAVFDTDFVPGPDFLRRTVPFFTDPRIGLVQTRWGHLNEDYSLLTRAQALGIDGHFAIEQPGRCWGGYFLNFNGTAGIWRREAIMQAGGWQPDTLTEDLDLSYRAQLAGWRMEYLPDVEVPSELPVEMSAFKNQQRRWAKGSIQTAIKLLPKVFSADLSFMVKLQAVFQLTHYMIHPLMLTVALLSVPLLTHGESPWAFLPFAPAVLLLALATAGPSTLYVAAQRALHADWRRRILRIPVLMVLGTGLAVSNARAVLEALLGIPSGFVRTPKHNIIGVARSTQSPHYRVPIDSVLLLEAILALYCTVGLSLSLGSQYLISPFLFLYTLGFTLMVVVSGQEMRVRWRSARAPSQPDEVPDRIRTSELAYGEAIAAGDPQPHSFTWNDACGGWAYISEAANHEKSKKSIPSPT